MDTTSDKARAIHRVMSQNSIVHRGASSRKDQMSVPRPDESKDYSRVQTGESAGATGASACFFSESACLGRYPPGTEALLGTFKTGNGEASNIVSVDGRSKDYGYVTINNDASYRKITVLSSSSEETVEDLLSMNSRCVHRLYGAKLMKEFASDEEAASQRMFRNFGSWWETFNMEISEEQK